MKQTAHITATNVPNTRQQEMLLPESAGSLL
jgi:hypothetical protein